MQAKTFLCAMLAACAGLAVGRVSLACTTPVCQYAMERWSAGQYRVTVGGGHLTQEQLALARRLQEAAGDTEAPANLDVHILAENMASGASAPPAVVTGEYPPDEEAEGVAFKVPVDAENVARVIDSPVRSELGRRLLGGEAAVWILLARGDSAQGRAAMALLGSELGRLEDALTRPPEPGLGVTEPFRPTFSLLLLDADDPQESVLRQTLLNTEPDLAEYEQAGVPIAFPVYGRGRVLYALIGSGINTALVEEACRFVSGPCACEIKAQSPGTDLLMAADWGAALLPARPADDQEVVLTGVLTVPPPDPPAAATVQAGSATPADQSSTGMPARRGAFTLGVVALLAGGATALLWLRSRREERL